MLLKRYSDFGGGKTKSDSEFLSYNLMLNSGKKFRDKKNKYSNSRVVRTKFLNETKNHNPPSPLQVEWSGRKWFGMVIGMCCRFQQLFSSIVNNRFTGGETM